MSNLHDKAALPGDIWNVFTSDPTTGVSLLSPDGEILYINAQSVEIFFDEARDPEALRGKRISELGFPGEWVEERLALMRRICDTGEPVLLRTIWNGKQQFSWMSPIKPEGDDREHVLVITRRLPSTEDVRKYVSGDHEVVQSGVARLGELSVLTPRELEVLALLGQGMSIKEIANTLFRSAKTIENHREAIGRKLNKTRGVELAWIANVAGLEIDDSRLKRVDGASG